MNPIFDAEKRFNCRAFWLIMAIQWTGISLTNLLDKKVSLGITFCLWFCFLWLAITKGIKKWEQGCSSKERGDD